MSFVNNCLTRARASCSKFRQFELFSAPLDGSFQHQEQPQETQYVFFQDQDQQQEYFSDIDIDHLLLSPDFAYSCNGQDYSNPSNIHINQSSTTVSNQLNEPDLFSELDSYISFDQSILQATHLSIPFTPVPAKPLNETKGQKNDKRNNPEKCKIKERQKCHI